MNIKFSFFDLFHTVYKYNLVLTEKHLKPVKISQKKFQLVSLSKNIDLNLKFIKKKILQA